MGEKCTPQPFYDTISCGSESVIKVSTARGISNVVPKHYTGFIRGKGGTVKVWMATNHAGAPRSMPPHVPLASRPCTMYSSLLPGYCSVSPFNVGWSTLIR